LSFLVVWWIYVWLCVVLGLNLWYVGCILWLRVGWQFFWFFWLDRSRI
jgi:hypothetical protein